MTNTTTKNCQRSLWDQARGLADFPLPPKAELPTAMANPDFIVASSSFKAMFDAACKKPADWTQPLTYHGVPIMFDQHFGVDVASGTDKTSIYIGTPYTENKMPNSYAESLYRYQMPRSLELMGQVLGTMPNPLKPGATIKGPDGREYIIAKVAPKPKAPKPAKKDYTTVGIRYLEGSNLERVYTYRVKKGAKLHLGQEVVVPAKRNERVNNFIAVVVEIHKVPQDTGLFEYRYVLGTVKPL